MSKTPAKKKKPTKRVNVEAAQIKALELRVTLLEGWVAEHETMLAARTAVAEPKILPLDAAASSLPVESGPAHTAPTSSITPHAEAVLHAITLSAPES